MAKLIRFPAVLEAKIAATAERERRTFTAQVLLWIERGMEADPERTRNSVPQDA